MPRRHHVVVSNVTLRLAMGILQLGLNHFQASLLYIGYNILFVLGAMVLQYYIDNYILIIVLLALAFGIVSIPSLLVKRGHNKVVNNTIKEHRFNRFFKKLADKSDTH